MKEENLQNTKGWLLGGENDACGSRTPRVFFPGVCGQEVKSFLV